MGRFFSVLIPAYNAEKFIERALESVYKQTFKDYEVIVVDDGSKDNTKEIVCRFRNRHLDMDLQYYWQENGGAASARYACGNHASGEYLAFLDADDIWYHDKLQTVREYITSHPAEVYYHDEIVVSLNGKRKVNRYRQLDNHDPLSDLIIKGNALSTSATVVHRGFYSECDPFKGKKRMCEDYECWIILASKGAKFVHIDKILGEYIRNENSLTLISEKNIVEGNKEILTFYDYLDKSKYSYDEISKLRSQRVAINEYVLGRYFQKRCKFAEAIECYGNAIRLGKKDIKCNVGLLLSKIHISV